MASGEYYSGQVCPRSGTYGQYHDTDGAYYGERGDRYVEKGTRFPPSQNNYHWRLKS